jgi:alpha-methylacyl-CoA racemase
MVDGGAHFYGVYECGDGRYVAIGPLEPQFYALLLDLCGITDPAFADQWDEEQWAQLKIRLAEVFKTRTRAEWCALLEGTDACFAPVLDLDEAPRHPHNQARRTFVEVDGVVQPAPAPRFSRTVPEIRPSASLPEEEDLEAVLQAWGASLDDSDGPLKIQ